MESNGVTRREMLKGVGLVGIGALLGSGLTLAGALSVASQRMFVWLDENI